MDDTTTTFDAWLSKRFQELNTDEAVFVPYVKSILEGDETLEDKIDALDGILGELAEAADDLNVEALRTEIISRWDEEQCKIRGAVQNAGAGDSSAELESKLDKLLKINDNLTSSSNSNQEDSKGSKSMVTPDSALRAAILSQYKDSTDDESDGERPSGPVAGGGSSGSGMGASGPKLERNTNAERVQNELKDKREREKEDAAKKREKDREDRAKQKQQAQERKDKAKKKSAKVERKR